MVAYSFNKRFVPPIPLDLMPAVEIGGEPPLVRAAALDLFARFDGFKDWTDMRGFWATAHPEVTDFSGVLIRWEPKS